MATAYFALPCKSVSLQPFLEDDCYKSKEVSRQKAEQKRLLCPSPFLINSLQMNSISTICLSITLSLSFLNIINVAFIGVACGKSLINGY